MRPDGALSRVVPVSRLASAPTHGGHLPTLARKGDSPHDELHWLFANSGMMINLLVPCDYS